MTTIVGTLAQILVVLIVGSTLTALGAHLWDTIRTRHTSRRARADWDRQATAMREYAQQVRHDHDARVEAITAAYATLNADADSVLHATETIVNAHASILLPLFDTSP